MIESISIRNLGVIESAQLELGPGFTALTGETGAGKTMVLSALGLLLGGRADATAVRSGASALFAEGCWRVADAELLARLESLGADVAAGELIVNRSVSAEGRSRAAVSGASVPISVLADIAQQLVAVHGQSDQIRLRSAAHQRAALDEFAGAELAVVLADYRQSYEAWRDTERRLDRIRNASATEAARASELRSFLQDLEKLNPEPGEDRTVVEQIDRLSNVEGLRSEAMSAHEALSSDVSDFDAIGLLGIARRSLEGASDPQLRELGQRLVEAGELVGDVSHELASYLVGLEADPARLEQLQQRRSDITQFCRRWGGELDELIARGPAASAELLDIDSGEDQIERLEQLYEAQYSQLGQAARALTATRRQAAVRLGAAVAEELRALAMAGASIEIQISEQGFDSHGADRIEFLLAAHPGAEPRPLAKSASGGELSRVMLAIELVLAGDNALPTMIFDEVDAGVGGAAAVELGRRLRKLSESTQVIVVTHLPQVAAFADVQLRVSKDHSGGFTASSVERLEGEGRVLELARMLSGNPESEVAREHARELLAH